jgi:hypothetical protein
LGLTPFISGAPDRISGRFAARLSSRYALLGANAALWAAKFEPASRRKTTKAPQGGFLLDAIAADCNLWYRLIERLDIG